MYEFLLLLLVVHLAVAAIMFGNLLFAYIIAQHRARHATTWEDIRDLPMSVIDQHDNAHEIFRQELARHTQRE